MSHTLHHIFMTFLAFYNCFNSGYTEVILYAIRFPLRTKSKNFNDGAGLLLPKNLGQTRNYLVRLSPLFSK